MITTLYLLAQTPLNDDLCYPQNLDRNISGTFPYVRTGYSNLNPHSDTIVGSNTQATFFMGEIIEDTGSCSSTSAILSPVISYTVCSSLRQANPGYNRTN